jgi:hypothetical protein
VVEIVKNPAGLTEFEKHFVDLYVINWAVLYYSLKTKYPNPKDYAEKVILRIAKSRSSLAENFLFMYGNRATTTDLFRPKELNEILKKNLDVLEADSSTTNRYLRESIIRQILRKLERYGVYINIKGKQEIKKYQGRKPKSTSILKRSGGRPSAYLVSSVYTTSNENINNPQIRNTIHKKLIDSNLGPLLWKYLFLVLFYSIRENKEVALKVFPLAGPPSAAINLTNIKSELDKIASLDGKELERFAIQSATVMLNSHNYFSASGLLGLLQQS